MWDVNLRSEFLRSLRGADDWTRTNDLALMKHPL